MSRSSKGAGSKASRQAVKDVNVDIKAIREKSRQLLAKVGKDIRAVRKDVSTLKKSGLVSKRVNAASYFPTKYMLNKIEKNRDVISGEAVAVRASKDVRSKYVNKGLFEQRGSSLIVPKEYSNQKTRISRGMVEISRPLKRGEERRLILPFKATDMEQVATKMLENPEFENMKEPDELFGFRMYGHTMETFGFPNLEMFAEYVLQNYKHMFKGKKGKEGVKHFELVRFKNNTSLVPEGPQEAKFYSPRPPRTKTQDWLYHQKMQRLANKKRKDRAKETEAERKARLEYQRQYAARKRQAKFLGD